LLGGTEEKFILFMEYEIYAKFLEDLFLRRRLYRLFVLSGRTNAATEVYAYDKLTVSSVHFVVDTARYICHSVLTPGLRRELLWLPQYTSRMEMADENSRLSFSVMAVL
jgi:hypothetical protein